MHPILLSAAILLAAPLVRAAGTDGRPAGTIPKLDVPEPPAWEDVEHPEFEPYPAESGEMQNNAILEQFDGPEEEVWRRWHRSTATRNGEEPYEGEWAVEEHVKFKGFDHDNALVLKSELKPAAIARKIEPPIRTDGDEPWVVQYELKQQIPLRCGGGYVKLLPPTASSDWSEFSNDTPYLVMFGPDKCGPTDKVHFILRRNGTEHHLAAPPRSRSSVASTLYTLVVYPDQRYEIRIDGHIVSWGSLLDADSFEPPLSVPAEIDDENDTKPSDWVDDEYIPDPDEPEKPADWDEDAPYLIPDASVEKPAAWREDVPLYIPDPDAEKPRFWDELEDGEWTAPEIVNPLCVDLDEENGEGCGEWKAPLVRNPAFKGRWSQPLVINPAYEGEWLPRKIPNPEFDPNLKPGQLEQPIGGVGFELLTVQGDLAFDNLYIGRSVRDAENIGNATWAPKFAIESEAIDRAAEAYRQQNAERARQLDAETPLLERYQREFEDFKLDPKGYCSDTYDAFLDAFRMEKLSAIKAYPVTALVVSTLLTLASSLIFGLFNVLLHLLTRKSPAPRTAEVKKAQPAEPAEPAHPAQPAQAAQPVSLETSAPIVPQEKRGSVTQIVED